MGLADVIRNGVAIAHRVVGALEVNVTHYPWIANGATMGEPTYDTGVTRAAIVDFKQKLRRNAAGQEVLQIASITFLTPITANGATDRREPIDPRDKIVLPNGYFGPILDVSGVVDPSTNYPYATEVILG